jgi:ribose transport system substrate-binding protein
MACGGQATSTTPTRASTVIETKQAGNVISDWLQWDKKSCTYKTVSQHPSSYSAELRTLGKPMNLGYVATSQSLESEQIANKSVKDAAASAGLNLILGDNNNPSTTDPVPASQGMALKKPDVVLEGLVITSLMDSVLGNFKNACIPAIQRNVPYPGIPWYGIDRGLAGKLIGTYLSDFATKKGWTAVDTTIVVQNTPEFGADVARGGAACKDNITAKLSSIPSQDLLTPNSGDGAQRVMTDWLTAHPTAKHVLVCSASNTYGIPYAKAVPGSRAPNVAIASLSPGAITDADKAYINAPGNSFVASVNQNPSGIGTYWVAMAEDVFEGKPIPVQVSPILNLDKKP